MEVVATGAPIRAGGSAEQVRRRSSLDLVARKYTRLQISLLQLSERHFFLGFCKWLWTIVL